MACAKNSNQNRRPMSRKWWIYIFIIPNLRSLALWLRTKDENSTGADDEAARAVEAALQGLEAYLSSE